MIVKQQQIVLASSNTGKIKEFQSILTEHAIIPQAEFNVTEAKETGSTFIENAIIKARHAACQSKMVAVADDSGLVVDALQGAPGIFSARYAGAGASDQENLLKLLEEMKDIPEPQRSARFICVIVLLEHADDPTPVIAQGVWEGQILDHACGENGFGYDPVFWVPEYHCTSAQLKPEIKNTLSHRGKALKLLTESM